MKRAGISIAPFHLLEKSTVPKELEAFASSIQQGLSAERLF
jgi:hypothetical protein